MVSPYSPGWLLAHYVAEPGLELKAILLLYWIADVSLAWGGGGDLSDQRIKKKKKKLYHLKNDD